MGNFGNKCDALSHTFDLNGPVLFDNKLAQEQHLIESWILSYSQNIVLVEFVGLCSHSIYVEDSIIIKIKKELKINHLYDSSNNRSTIIFGRFTLIPEPLNNSFKN